MQSFTALSAQFEAKFNKRHFPEHTPTLYDPAQYILGIKGKRIRPICVYLANELFAPVTDDAYYAAASIELFHNFSLIHDDIMDKAPLRRGLPTVHEKYGHNTALLAGDVMFVTAYENLGSISAPYLPRSIEIFNKTAKEVCEGQQLDMDFENMAHVSLDDYVKMITLKTSVLVAASLQMGAVLGGAGLGNQNHLYEFGKNLGIAFQIQDDFLDAFGDAQKTGKQQGGDILANKKTFLLIHAREQGDASINARLDELLANNAPDKVPQVLQIFKEVKADEWCNALKEKYYQIALQHLDEVAVLSERKTALQQLAADLMMREK
ncbi:polyprenyl synthetase family protein [Ferruginibacter yonginensis]|uniref:Polyprenyl synthetase family protein n=1 Tax=Ferruginibacter yonginensis TaxID=1310416 RepID=A0ABV8QNU8_9BACT